MFPEIKKLTDQLPVASQRTNVQSKLFELVVVSSNKFIGSEQEIQTIFTKIVPSLLELLMGLVTKVTETNLGLVFIYI